MTGISRLNLKFYASVVRVNLKIQEVTPDRLSEKIQICFHRSDSLTIILHVNSEIYYRSLIVPLLDNLLSNHFPYFELFVEMCLWVYVNARRKSGNLFNRVNGVQLSHLMKIDILTSILMIKCLFP